MVKNDTTVEELDSTAVLSQDTSGNKLSLYKNKKSDLQVRSNSQSTKLIFQGTHLSCPRIELDLSASWENVETAFKLIHPIPLIQGWQDKPDPGYESAWVRVAYNRNQLLVLAELNDKDIFNPAKKFNDPCRNQGDFFELILQPLGQQPYYELHVTPQNYRSQYRWPRLGMMKEIAKLYPSVPIVKVLGVNRPIFNSRTLVKREANYWKVFISVNLKEIIEGAVRPNKQIAFSFCRYNYTRPNKTAQLSSTSPFTRKDFHDSKKWGLLQLE